MRVPTPATAVLMLRHESIRFVITGGSAAVLFYLLTLSFIDLGAAPFTGTLGAYAIALMASYTVQHAWTFRGRQAHRRSFPRYLAAQAVAAILASTVARAASECGFPHPAVALFSTLGGSAVSFVLSKFWVFAHRTRETANA